MTDDDFESPDDLIEAGGRILQRKVMWDLVGEEMKECSQFNFVPMSPNGLDVEVRDAMERAEYIEKISDPFAMVCGAVGTSYTRVVASLSEDMEFPEDMDEEQHDTLCMVYASITALLSRSVIANLIQMGVLSYGPNAFLGKKVTL